PPRPIDNSDPAADPHGLHLAAGGSAARRGEVGGGAAWDVGRRGPGGTSPRGARPEPPWPGRGPRGPGPHRGIETPATAGPSERGAGARSDRPRGRRRGPGPRGRIGRRRVGGASSGGGVAWRDWPGGEIGAAGAREARPGFEQVGPRSREDGAEEDRGMMGEVCGWR